MSAKKPLTILFDANPIAIAGKSGVGYYAGYLVRSIAETFPDEVQFIGHYYDFLGRKQPQNLPTGPNIRYRPTKLFPGKVTNMLRRFGISIPFELLIRHRGDVLFFPNFLTQPSLFRKPIVTVIHDLCFVRYPEYVSTLNLHDLRLYVPASIKRSSLIIANSAFTKQEIRSEFGVPSSKLVVAPIPPLHMTPLPAATAKKLVKELGITKPYIFFISTIEPRKNLSTLVEAYAQLPAKLREQYSLVLAGGKGWKNEQLLARIQELQRNNVDIIMPGYVSEEQRAALNQEARIATLPSYYEGFGMTILEAFEFRRPMAVSDIPIHREIGEDALIYFNPNDSADIARTLTKLLTDEALQRRLVAREAAILDKYSWTKNAETVMAAIRRIL